MYCGLSTASEVFLIFTTQLYQYFSVFFLFAPVCEEPEVFLPKCMYCKTAVLNAAHFRRVVIVISVYNRQNEVKLLDFLTGRLEWPPSTSIFFIHWPSQIHWPK